MHQKKEKDKLYYLRRYSSICILKRAPKKQETPWEQKQKEIDRKKKQIKAVMKEMDARKHEFIASVISGKIPPLKETAEIQEEMWHVMVEMTAFLSLGSMRRFFTGKQDYECKPEEKAEADSKIKKLSVLSQMMISLSCSLESTREVCDWQLHHLLENCREIRRAYAILERYGWSYTQEEQQILDGTHEFYVPEEKK